MRLPLLLLLAVLALLATIAGAEDGLETTVRTRFQSLVQKAQDRIATFQTSAIYQQVRELAQAGLEHAQNALEQVKTRVSSLLERNPA